MNMRKSSLSTTHLDYISFHWYWLPTAEDIEHKLQAMGMNYRWRTSPNMWCEYDIYPSHNAVRDKEYTVTAASRARAAGKALLELLLEPSVVNGNSTQDSVLNYTLRDILAFDEQQVALLLTKLRDLITINK